MGEQSARPDSLVAEMAARQHGVVSIGQLHEAGLGRNAIARRVQAGRLHRLHRGVYAVGFESSNAERRWMAAVLACGHAGAVGRRKRSVEGEDGGAAAGPGRTVLAHWGAALSHRSAACLWQLLQPREGPVDVSIAADPGRGRRKGIRLHRSLSLTPAAVTLRSGIPVTTPARTLTDLRRSAAGSKRLVSPRELRRAIRQAEVLGLPVGDEAGSDRTRSDLEWDFLRLCRRHDLPAPEVNVRVGPHLVDFLWRSRSLIVETDGYRYHRGRAAFEGDRERDVQLRALGYEVVRLSDRQVSEERSLVLEVLRSALRLPDQAGMPSGSR